MSIKRKSDLADTLSVLLIAKTLKLPETKKWLLNGELKYPKSYCYIEYTRSAQLVHNHENLDTRIVLHALDATAVGYKRNVDKCHGTDQGINQMW